MPTLGYLPGMMPPDYGFGVAVPASGYLPGYGPPRGADMLPARPPTDEEINAIYGWPADWREQVLNRRPWSSMMKAPRPAAG